MSGESPAIVHELQERFPGVPFTPQETRDGVPTLWLGGDRPAGRLVEVLRWLKEEAARPYATLYDLTAIDERERVRRDGQPASAFTVVYHLLSYERNEDLRLKVPLAEGQESVPTVTGLWPAANWYERELWDMFGVRVEGHPGLTRILSPPWWEGHPLRKEHPARATEMGVFLNAEAAKQRFDRMMEFRPEEHGLPVHGEEFDYLYVNMGPQHPGTHGPLRLVLQMDGQEVVDVFPDIGFHHRGQEKMAERQTWHTYIPYTDRVDYLSGVLNNFPYVLAVEALAGIEVPERARVIRILLAELFRIINHLVFYGTLVQDVGAMSPVFYMFTDRERAFDIIEAVTGGRMHPGWFRIGGVAQDLPEGWREMIRGFLDYLPPRLREYDRMVMRNRIFRARTRGIGCFSREEAIGWGASGPMLRSAGVDWDWRKRRPYGGYDQFEFEVPVGTSADVYDRAVIHVEEMWQSLRIIGQCLERMPDGLYKSKHPLTTPPIKDNTMRDIETLIHHFLGVSWGPVIPAGEAFARIESSKGAYSYYLVSDGNIHPYRNRIRTASFPHIQMIPLMTRGLMIPDVASVLGGIDFVLSDVDR